MNSSHPDAENGRVFKIRERDLEREVQVHGRLTHLETREKFFSEQIGQLAQINEELQAIKSSTIVIQAVSDALKEQKKTMLTTLGVVFGGLGALVALIKLLFSF